MLIWKLSYNSFVKHWTCTLYSDIQTKDRMYLQLNAGARAGAQAHRGTVHLCRAVLDLKSKLEETLKPGQQQEIKENQLFSYISLHRSA